MAIAADPLAQWWVHEVTVERHAADTAEGESYDPPETLRGFVNDQRRLVRAATGEQVVSETQVLLPKDTATIPVQSIVTLPAIFGGRASTVVAFSRFDGGGLATPDHVEVALA